MNLGYRCKHGLYKNCHLCHYENEIERLKEENEKLKQDKGEMEMRKQLREFAEKMEVNLKENDYKGGWEKCDYDYLLRRIKEELSELEEALVNNRTAENIETEAADVANFAMMIADNAKRKVLPKAIDATEQPSAAEAE